MEARDFEQNLNRYLEPLRALPFVKSLEVQLESQLISDHRVDAEIRVRTPRGTFKFAAEFKGSYLDHTGVGGIIAQHKYLSGRLKTPLLLVARYIPATTGDRLAQAGVNFVDGVGNVHLNLGGYYHVFIVGRKEAKPRLAERRTSAAVVQVMSAFLIDENATTLPVRKLGKVAGVGKTAAGEARQYLTQKGILVEGMLGLQMANKNTLAEDFLAAYMHVLRPNLWIGTFGSECTPDALLRRIREEANSAKIGWALTGTQAAFVLERLYRGERTTFFWAGRPEHLDGLNLVPDDKGTVTVLRSFGTIFPWRIQRGMPLAHPLLICAELPCEGGPKAPETAAHIRKNYLGE
jgi:hypothetical protein